MGLYREECNAMRPHAAAMTRIATHDTRVPIWDCIEKNMAMRNPYLLDLVVHNSVPVYVSANEFGLVVMLHALMAIVLCHVNLGLVIAVIVLLDVAHRTLTHCVACCAFNQKSLVVIARIFFSAQHAALLIPSLPSF